MALFLSNILLRPHFLLKGLQSEAFCSLSELSVSLLLCLGNYIK